MKVNESTDPWQVCTWEGSELYHLRRDAARSFRDNLIWLEEMTELAERFAKAPWLEKSLVSDSSIPNSQVGFSDQHTN